MITDINSEDRLVQATFADHLHEELGWESIYAYNRETFGPNSTLGRNDKTEVVLVRDLTAAFTRLNPDLPLDAIAQAVKTFTTFDYSRSLIQLNKEFASYIRDGVPVKYQDQRGQTRHAHAKVIDFRNGIGSDGIPNNRFLVVRELWISGKRAPHYNRRADLVCFVNGIPLVFIELKAVYKNIRLGFDNNLTDYMTPQVIPHAFYHNAFLVVSNGDRARYGSITSTWEHFNEWKRNDEKDTGRVDAEALLNGMLQPDRLLDLVENFILFDESRAGGTRKVVARNHQVLGVNNAVESVIYQEALKKQYPVREIQYTIPTGSPKVVAEAGTDTSGFAENEREELLSLVKRAHPDLGRLGVFWHTQGSGKSYSMAFFTEKVRRVVPGSFTFVLMTDRDNLDDQIFRTFEGIGIADDQTPRASSGKDLEKLLKENHRFLFTLIQKFKREEPPEAPYSTRDDIIVISDEAHRTQGGKLARNMRIALPNASFIGFTGTPLFKYDHLTRRIFGDYISKYDFKRSEEDGSTVRLVYENRGEKLGLARLDLNARIADKVEEAELNPDQTALLERLLGRDYEVITADDRLDKLATDFVEHCSMRWESGKSMFVCIDKITCARMYQLIIPRWSAKIEELKAKVPLLEDEIEALPPEDREELEGKLVWLVNLIDWMESTRTAIIISEAQNEVRDFQKWDFDIIPHRTLIKQGFETDDGKRVDIESAFKDPEHPFRIAIVCAMWLTGFDVESLSTLYIDKPMKAHTLMQAIARANRVYPGKDCGVIVDYNGMLKSLREALAQYAIGGDDDGGDDEIVEPIENRVAALKQAIEETESHLIGLGFNPVRLHGKKGFDRIAELRDAVDVLYTSDESKRRFEIMSRVVFERFKALLMEPSVAPYAERHDNIEAIYKKLLERRDTADVTEVLKEIHRIVNEAIQTQGTGVDHTEGVKVDLSTLNFERLRDEFSCRIKRRRTAIQDIRELVEHKLQLMLAQNPLRMDYYKKYQEIIADYNNEKDRATIEETFIRLQELVNSLDEEQKRSVVEGLSEDELAIYDLLNKDTLSKAEREKVKMASKSMLSSLQTLLASMEQWTENPQTQAEVEVFILDELYQALTCPPFTEQERDNAAHRVYEFVWQRWVSGYPFGTATAV